MEVLKINRIELSIIQFLSYLAYLIGPIAGFTYDKFSSQKKRIIGFSSVFLVLSFSLFILNLYNLLFFGLFLSLNFICGLLIKAGMSKYILEKSDNKKFKKNAILISNLSASIGGIFPILLFNIFITNMTYIDSWISFFNSCWIVTLPILFSVFFLRDSNYEIDQMSQITKTTLHKAKNLPFILTFLANFLIWADKLIEFPYTSWIFNKFGESGLIAYSYSFFIFTYLNMFGWLIARKIPRIKNLKVNMTILISIYSLLLYCLIFANLTFFLILSAINQVIIGIMMSHFTEKNVDISRNSKNQAFRYEILRGAYCLSSLIFGPLGTLLSFYIPIEVLIIIVVFVSLFSITPIYFIKT